MFKKKYLLLLLFPLSILINMLFSHCPGWVEKWYATRFNRVVRQGLSHLFGIFPFSVFEWLIFFTLIGLVGYSSYVIVKCIQKSYVKRWGEAAQIFLNGIGHLAIFLSLLLFLFLVLWGYNYKRPSFSSLYEIPSGTYTPENLGDLYEYLLQEANAIRSQLPEDEMGVMQTYGNYKDIFNRAQKGYDAISSYFTVLGGSYGRPKPILLSKLMNYTGITGIYSPFTGEPNVNTANIPMNLPVTTLHEMAHQRGYGSEDECNFIAYLTAIYHPDLDFQYSGYILAIAYTSNALAKVDLDRLQQLNLTMSDAVLRDLEYHNAFWQQYEGKVQEASNHINDSYLEANGVAGGTQSYGRVVDLLLGYYDALIHS